MRSALPAQGDRHENNPKTATFAGGGAVGYGRRRHGPAAYLSVGYFNGGGDVTAGPGGDIDKLDVTQITHLNYSFGLIYNGEKDETNAALKDPAHRHQIYLSPKVMADLQRLPTLRKQNPELKVLLSVGGWGARGFAAAATAENRAIFIRSALQVIAQYQLDGIDLDWEYPVNGARGWWKANRQTAITSPCC